MIAKTKKSAPESNDPDDRIANLPMRDLKRAVAITGGNTALAEEMFALMLRDLRAQLEKILYLQREKDWGQLKLTVHRLRGSVTYCAVPALEHNLSILETAAASRKPKDIDWQIQALESLVERLVASQ
jgi:two-component system sensor histidine kinase BarA